LKHPPEFKQAIDNNFWTMENTMKDIIMHVKDVQAIFTELLADHPNRVDLSNPENPVFLIEYSTRVINKDNEFLALVRANDADLELIDGLTNADNLGSYEEVFADPEKLAIYDRIYDRTPVTFTDEDGTEHTMTPSDKFVVFS